MKFNGDRPSCSSLTRPFDDLYMAHSGKWVYIRFNPDKYINKNGIRKNPTIAARLNVLKDEIDKQINRIDNDENTELVERIYLYYDGYNQTIRQRFWNRYGKRFIKNHQNNVRFDDLM